MISIPSKIFERNISDIEVGVSDIHLFSKDEIEDAQIGYRIDDKGNKIEDWIGDNFVVIGIDSCNGDPIIVDINNEKLPVYSMFCDDWETLQIITDSFKQFIEILNRIDATELSDEEEKDNLISEIIKEVPEEGEEYWEGLIQVAYEFLNDID